MKKEIIEELKSKFCVNCEVCNNGNCKRLRKCARGLKRLKKYIQKDLSK